MKEKIIYTCPKCGADLEHMIAATRPPTHVWGCKNCDFRYSKTETWKVTRKTFREKEFEDL